MVCTCNDLADDGYSLITFITAKVLTEECNSSNKVSNNSHVAMDTQVAGEVNILLAKLQDGRG